MGHFKINEKDIFFILKDQLNYGSLCRQDRYKELDEETLDMLVSEAIKFAKGVVEPLQEIGEQWGIQFENGQVRCAPEFKEAFRLYGENGWTAAVRPPRPRWPSRSRSARSPWGPPSPGWRPGG